MDMKKLLIESFAKYDAKQEQENELQKQIDALKSEQTKIKYEREKIGDVINLIGYRKFKITFEDYNFKLASLREKVNAGDEAARQELKAYYDEYKKYEYEYKARTKKRGWSVVEISGSWTNRYISFEIDNKRRSDTAENYHHYSDLKTYRVSLIWRADLKKYKYEIEVSLPNKERCYGPNEKTSKKAKTLAEAIPILQAALKEAWTDFTTNDSVYKYNPDIWDFNAADIDDDVKSIDVVKLFKE